MASLPLDTSTIAATRRAPDKRRGARIKERAVRSGWRHLFFGSGPFWFRLLRFCQRNCR